MSGKDRIDKATNRLTLAYDVQSLARLVTEWTIVMAEESGGDTQEWVKALADEIGVEITKATT